MIAISIFLWLWLITAMAMAFRAGRTGGQKRLSDYLTFLSPLIAALTLLNIHEEIEGGYDGPAYLFGGQAMLEQNTFQLRDPALEALQPQERQLFRHGHRGFMLTKNHAIWFRDADMSEGYSWFFPAYSLLIGLFGRFGTWSWGFYASIVIALASAILIGLLVGRWSGCKLTGFSAALLYALNPAVAWNMRNLRAEWPASILVVAGTLLTLNEFDRPAQKGSVLRMAYAGAVFASAALFHATGLYLVIPAALVILVATTRGWEFTAWLLGASAIGLILVLQTVFVTDPYALRERLSIVEPLGLIAGVVALIGVLLYGRRISLELPSRLRERVMLLLSALACALFFASWLGVIPAKSGWGIPRRFQALLQPTDFRILADVVSLPLLISGFLGWVPSLVVFPRLRPVFMTFVAAVFLAGWADHLMNESRRYVMAVCPFLAIGSAVGIAWVSVGLSNILFRRILWKRLICRCVQTAAVVAMICAMMAGRWPLYTNADYSGALNFYKRLAEELKTRSDFLLVEYTQISAPLEYFTRLPTLPFSWDYRSESEYKEAQQVVVDFARRNPSTRFLLVSPFRGALIPGLSIEPGKSYVHQASRVESAVRRRPSKVTPWRREIFVNAVSASEAYLAAPYVRLFPGSRLGMEGASVNRLGRPATFSVFSLASVKQALERMAVNGTFDAGARLVMVFLKESEGHQRISNVIEQSIVEVDDNFYIGVVSPTELNEMLNQKILTSAAFLITKEGGLIRLDLAEEPSKQRTVKMDSQWLTHRANIALPAAPGGLLLWLGRGSPLENSPSKFQIGAGNWTGGDLPLGSEWAWNAILLPSNWPGPVTATWVSLQVDPPYDPGIRGFPNNLGFQIRSMVVLPSSHLK